MGAIPLPEGSNAAETIRRLRAIDAEIFGTIFAAAGIIGGDVTVLGSIVAGDIYSANWDGTIPIDLSGGKDTGATLGYAFDGSEGVAQFQEIHAEGGTLGDLTVDGDLTMGTGGVFRTAASGQRIELSNVTENKIHGFSGDPAEVQEGVINIDTNPQGSVTDERNIQWEIKTPYINVNEQPLTMVLGSGAVDGTSGKHITITKGDVDKPGDGTWGPDPYVSLQNGVPLWTDDIIGLTLSTSRIVFSSQLGNIGTAVNPAIGFGSNQDDGFYQIADGVLGVTIAGVKRYQFSNAVSDVLDVATKAYVDAVAGGGGLPTSGGTMTGAILGFKGTEALPGYAFSGDTGTGMWDGTTGKLGFSSEGVAILSHNSGSTWDFHSQVIDGVNEIRVDAGLAGDPGFTFITEQNTGMYLPNTNELGFTVNGVKAAALTTVNMQLGTATGTPSLKWNAAGGSSVPSYSFQGDTNLGMYRVGENILGFTTGGTLRFQVSNSYLNSGVTLGAAIAYAAGTNLLPNYSFVDDLGTGMYRSAVNELAFATGGVLQMHIDSGGGIVVRNEIQIGAGSVTDVPYTFTGDQDTGMYRLTDDSLGFSAGGVLRLGLTSAGINANTHKILNVVDPTSNQDAATKKYVDDNSGGVTSFGGLSDVTLTAAAPGEMIVLSGGQWINQTLAELGLDLTDYVPKAGTTMTGILTLSGAPSSNLHAATKLYVDTVAAGGGLPTTGGTMTGQITGYQGLVAAPTISVNAAGTSGMWNPTSDAVGFSVAGVDLWRITSTRAYSPATGTGGPRMKIDVAGTELLPAFSFDGDPDTGMYRRASNALALAVGGSRVFEVVGTGSKTVLGAEGTPSWSFIDDPDTGMYRPGTNQIGWSAGGNKKLHLTTTQLIHNDGSTGDIEISPKGTLIDMTGAHTTTAQTYTATEGAKLSVTVACDYASQPVYVHCYVMARAAGNFPPNDWWAVRIGQDGTALANHSGYRTEVIAVTGQTVDSDELASNHMWMGPLVANGSGNIVMNIMGQTKTATHSAEAQEIRVSVWRR